MTRQISYWLTEPNIGTGSTVVSFLQQQHNIARLEAKRYTRHELNSLMMLMHNIAILSICLSRSDIVLKPLNRLSYFLQHR